MTLCLVRTGRSRDVASFERLFVYFGPRIRSYMLKRALDGPLAEELMQETMMMVWRKASMFDPQRGNASAWVFTLARNVMIDNLRKAKRPQFDPNDPAFVPDAPEPPDSHFEQDESAKRMRQALSTLPKEQAELLHMSFFEDISHSMIAEKTNLPLGTVKSRIRAAFSKLRSTLGEER
nr:sigma-70 family RNA polymerase sigma factor [Marinicella sp. W31]MDC2877063.1 sigma-70 family RNA polymerase sigma factor [Marinicella sp. W31]